MGPFERSERGAERVGADFDLRGEGMSLLLVDQVATRALALADRAYVMASGTMEIEGDASAMARDPSLAAAYLGA